MRDPKFNRDSSYLFLGNVSVAILGLISGLIIIHNLDITNYGKWVLLLDLSLTLGSIVDFGLPNVIVRKWDGDAKSLGPFLSISQTVQRKIIFLIIIISNLSYLLLQNYHNLPFYPWFFLILGSSMNYLLGSYRMGLRLLGEAREESFALILDRVTMILCLYASTFFKSTLLSLSVAYSIGMVISFFYSRWRFISNLEPKFVVNHVTLPTQKDLIFDSFPFALTLLVIPMIGRIDKFVLGFFKGYEAVSVFNIAWLVILTGLLVPISIRQGAIAVFGNEKMKKSNLHDVIADSRGIVSLLTIIGIPSAILITHISFDTLFPNNLIQNQLFEVSGISLVILLLPAWIWAMLGCIELESLKLEKSPWAFSSILLFGLLINLIFSLLLIPKFETIGAAFSTGLSFFIIFLLATYYSGIYMTSKSLSIRKFIYGSLLSIILYLYAVQVTADGITENLIYYFIAYILSSTILYPDLIYLYRNFISKKKIMEA